MSRGRDTAYHAQRLVELRGVKLSEEQVRKLTSAAYGMARKLPGSHVADLALDLADQYAPERDEGTEAAC